MKLNDILSKVTESTLESLVHKLDEKISLLTALHENISSLQLRSDLENIKKELQTVNSLAAKQDNRLTRYQWTSFTNSARDWVEKLNKRKPEVLQSQDSEIRKLFVIVVQQASLFLKTLSEKQDNLIDIASNENGETGDMEALKNRKAAQLELQAQNTQKAKNLNKYVNTKVHF